MNKTRDQALAFARLLCSSPLAQSPDVRPFVIPPFPYIADVAAVLAETKVRVGAQNMHWADHGAWTGEISAPMLKDCGATLVEIGHSERRAHFGETDASVALKVQAALRHGLTALVCIGDTKGQHDAGETTQALERQVRAFLEPVGAAARDQVIIAYEPVWSIGEGGTPASPDFANQQHAHIKALSARLTGAALPVIYGGSVNAENCESLALQEHIDGLFIGRAAWDAKGYIEIMQTVIHALGDAP